MKTRKYGARHVILVLAWMTACSIALVAAAASGQAASSASDAFQQIMAQLQKRAPGEANANPWGDLRLESLVRENQRDEHTLAALRGIDRAALPSQEKLQYDRISYGIEQKIGAYRNHLYLFTPNARNGIRFSAQAAEQRRFATTRDYDAWILRLRKFGEHMDQYIALMREGERLGITQPREVIERIRPQIASQIVDDPAKSLFYKPFLHMPDSIPARDQERLRSEGAQAIAGVVVPAFKKYLDYFTNEYLPHARPKVGLSTVPGGEAIYAFLARYYTTTDMTPAQIHETGLKKVAQIKAQMESLMKSTGFKGSYAEFLKHLRTSPDLYYKSADEMLEDFRATAKRIDPLLVRMFPVSLLPRMPYGIRGISGGSTDDMFFAYSVPPAADGNVAGYMAINLALATKRAKFDTPALTCHEARPGHQLEIPISMEISGPSRFRLFGRNTAYIEGWALYAETLCDEMGVYTSDYERFAYLNYQMWRAVRLVVDTGIHTMGWSRQQAIDYFSANSSLDSQQITDEVDRYITNPGQALAYMIGETTIQTLRARAEQVLGPRFDVKQFHCAVLRHGELPLRLLSRSVNAWIDAAKASPPGQAETEDCRIPASQA